MDRLGNVQKSPRFKLVLIAAGFLGGAIAALVYFREPTQILTQEALLAARERWRGAAIGDYDLSYQMQRNNYEVQVRGGIVRDVLVNGLTPTNSEWKAYGMEGLFNVLAEDLDNFREGTTAGGGVTLRVRFDEKLGYVERYLRSGGGMRAGTIENVRIEKKE